MTNMKPRLFYVADPLCGWCYGFAPVLRRLREAYANQVEWTFLLGGMAIGEHAKPMAEVAAHIRSGIEVIRDRTGAQFSQAFYDTLLSKADERFDSILPCAAMAYLTHTTQVDWEELLAVYHHGFFVEGLAPSSDQLMEAAAKQAGSAIDGMLEAIIQPDNLARLRAQFDEAKALNISSFPALVLQQTDGIINPVVEGYETYDRVSALLDRLLASRLALN